MSPSAGVHQPDDLRMRHEEAAAVGGHAGVLLSGANVEDEGSPTVRPPGGTPRRRFGGTSCRPVPHPSQGGAPPGMRIASEVLAAERSVGEAALEPLEGKVSDVWTWTSTRSGGLLHPRHGPTEPRRRVQLASFRARRHSARTPTSSRPGPCRVVARRDEGPCTRLLWPVQRAPSGLRGVHGA